MKTYFLRRRTVTGKSYNDDDHPIPVDDDESATMIAGDMAAEIAPSPDVIVALCYRRDDGAVGQMQRFH